MELVESRCALCSQKSFDLLRPVPHDFVFCAACAGRLGELILAADVGSLAALWKVLPATRPAQDVGAEPETHADLAVAYLEMGLLPDALREAAEVLSTKVATKAAVDALRVLFSNRIAQPDAVTHLRKVLFPT